MENFCYRCCLLFLHFPARFFRGFWVLKLSSFCQVLGTKSVDSVQVLPVSNKQPSKALQRCFKVLHASKRLSSGRSDTFSHSQAWAKVAKVTCRLSTASLTSQALQASSKQASCASVITDNCSVLQSLQTLTRSRQSRISSLALLQALPRQQVQADMGSCRQHALKHALEFGHEENMQNTRLTNSSC